MNSRSNVNESNLVNFSTELPTLNVDQIESKDGLLTFPFDHLYACHSDGSGHRETIQLDKEVEITTHCIVPEDKELVENSKEVVELRQRVASFEQQNKALRDLLFYHLDLIQHQNEIISKNEKLHKAVVEENETLKSKLTRADKRVPTSLRPSLNPPPLTEVQPSTSVPVTSTVTSNTVKRDLPATSQIMLNSFTELLLPDNRTNPFIFDSDLNKTKPFGQETFGLARTTTTGNLSDVSSYLTGDLGVPTLMGNSNLKPDNTMVENKRSYNAGKKDTKGSKRSEPLYTVTSHSGNPIIQKVPRSKKRTGSNLGRLSRMAKTTPKVEKPVINKCINEGKSYQRYSVGKSKMINTTGKPKCSTIKKASPFGSLSERLQLIDTTPTGEDPYALGEEDMREQSPIPKLMLQKTNHGRMKVCTDTATADRNAMRFYESLVQSDPKDLTNIKLGKYNLTNTYVHPEELLDELPKTEIGYEPEVDVVKIESGIDWQTFNKPRKETSVCDFSYGETSSNLATNLLPSLDSVEFQDLFAPGSGLNLENLSQELYAAVPDEPEPEKSVKRGARTNNVAGGKLRNQHGSKPSRKRAHSTTGLMKALKQKIIGPAKPKVAKTKVPNRTKKAPLPGMTTQTPYHTLVGDPDLSWYLGLDPNVKLEDVDLPADSKASTVEVPRWREKHYTSCYTMEGTENLDDKVFEKRHQKLEAEERRQLRWHMRRIREQRHMERLRQRHRDSWCGDTSTTVAPSLYTVWPQPQRDAHFIQITDTLPVMAFGEIMPQLPETEFTLPWVKTGKAMKRSKRSRTFY